MNIKKVLCNMVFTLKSEQELTYKDIVDKCHGGVHKSQVGAILKNDGEGVSVETIIFVIECLGAEVEVSLLSVQNLSSYSDTN